jgi:hypothetical protein
MFWSFINKDLDIAVTPMPLLQVLNAFAGLLVILYEWPSPLIVGSVLHRSVKARLYYLPIPIICSSLVYQTFDTAIYYTFALGIYVWAFLEREVCLTRLIKNLGLRCAEYFTRSLVYKLKPLYTTLIKKW